MWNSCRSEMLGKIRSLRTQKIAPFNQNGDERRGGLVERQSKVDLLHVRANVLAALCP